MLFLTDKSSKHIILTQSWEFTPFTCGVGEGFKSCIARDKNSRHYKYFTRHVWTSGELGLKEKSILINKVVQSCDIFVLSSIPNAMSLFFLNLIVIWIQPQKFWTIRDFLLLKFDKSIRTIMLSTSNYLHIIT